MLCQEWASLTQPSELVAFGLEVAPKEKGVGHPCGQSEHMSNHYELPKQQYVLRKQQSRKFSS